jgi:Fe-S-cluster containining protein
LEDLTLLKLLGLELTLAQYEAEQLRGAAPHFDQEPLRFGCTGCGACCTRHGAVYFTDLDIERVAAWYEVPIDQIRHGLLDETEDGDFVVLVDEDQLCPFYDPDQSSCIIHEVKPTQCRTYPFWPELVYDRDAWREEAQLCPGIDQGRTWAPDEVRALLVGLGDTDLTAAES